MRDPTKLRMGWEGVLRRVPLGVMALGVLLCFLGVGLVVGGVYLALAGRDAGWVVVLAALGVGPLTLYFALHFLRLSRWTWLTVMVLLVLLLLSSVLRSVRAPGVPLAPLAEVAVEAGSLLYLSRRRIRHTFGWS